MFSMKLFLNYNLITRNSFQLSRKFLSNVVSNRKLKQKERSQRYSEKYSLKNEQNLQSFHSLLRQLYRKTHPDLVRSHSEAMSKVNDTSMQELNGVLSTIKTTDFPPAIDKRFTFYVKNSTQSYEKFELHLKTSGGDCRKQLKTTFESFFKITGISDTSFKWDVEYFPVLKYSELSTLETNTENTSP